MLKKRNNLTNIRRNSNKNKTKKNVEKIVKKKSSNNVKRNVKNNVKKVVKKNSNKKTRKMLGGNPRLLTEEEMRQIQPVVNNILRQWTKKFGALQVAMDFSPEDGHTDVNYYKNTLTVLEKDKINIAIKTFVEQFESFESFNEKKILVIDGENKMNKYIQEYGAKNGSPPIDYFCRIFNCYDFVIIVFKSPEVARLSNQCKLNLQKLNLQKTNFLILDVGDVSIHQHSVDDMLVVFIVKYLEKKYNDNGIQMYAYNTKMGIDYLPNRNNPRTLNSTHSLEAFRSNPYYSGDYVNTSRPPSTSYDTPFHYYGYQLPQLSVATGDKYIFI